jgi:dipeptide/tripeptide permease
MTQSPRPTLLGQPTGLFTLFFAEMWERFSYYGMRALLVLYMLKGFLGYGDKEAYAVYGAYVAMVYATPFLGGMLADRLLGARRAVVLGGLLMAAGHLLMTIEAEIPFLVALALLIVGNGFFKPNISTMVGALYDGPKDPRRDAGFTIFYMGINLGAALAPLLCGYVGETYGWHYGFGLATGGMLVGLAVFVVPDAIARALILGGALLTAVGSVAVVDDALLLAVNGFVALALAVAGVAAFVAIGREGLGPDAGGPPDAEALRRPVLGPLTAEWAVYLGALLAVPVFAVLVGANRTIRIIPAETIARFEASESVIMSVVATFLGELSSPAGLLLLLSGVVAVAYLLRESFLLEQAPRERIWFALSMMFFSMLFWAFFEQAGSSINTFTDRNVDRVYGGQVVTADDVGTAVAFRVGPKGDASLPLLSQEQVGYPLPDALHDTVRAAVTSYETARGKMAPELVAPHADAVVAQGVLTLTALDALRAYDAAASEPLRWEVGDAHVGMTLATSEVPASTFQSANPIFILLFGIPFSMLWAWLGARGREPTTVIKFALGLVQLSLGFAALWWGATHPDARGMVGVGWLVAGYLLHTTGELCLSPVGLSMITRLTVKHLVSTAMGAWFLATAFSGLLAAIIAGFTGIGHGESGAAVVPPPVQTAATYAGVFGNIAVAAMVSVALLLALSPLLHRWMHQEEGA